MKRRFWILDFGFWIGWVASATLVGCDQAAPSTKDASGSTESKIQNPKSKIEDSIHFTDITSSAGIDMTITCGALPSTEILEVNGGGLGLIDFDNDGDLDLFVANGATLETPDHGPGCRLYENLGQFKFRDITAPSGIDSVATATWATGAAVGDYDGDGFDDVYVCCYGPNILLRNNGDRTFTNVTGFAFDERESSIPEWSTSAAFGDVDNDGDLDLYVCNYLEFDLNNRPARSTFKGVEVMGGPHGLTPQHDVLYLNKGDGSFMEATEKTGCLPSKAAFGLNVVIVDFDGDGWQDISVANDSMPGFLFHNRGMKESLIPSFQEIGVISGIAANADGNNQAAMGLAIADVDGNGLPDKFTTVFSSDVNALHVNVTRTEGRGLRTEATQSPVPSPQSPSPSPLFEDRSQQFGLAMISRPYLGWSAGFFDFDHDADEDLLFVNGHVYPQATVKTMDSEYEQTPLLFERDGARFKRVTAERGGAWLDEKHRDRNAVFADFDGDGDIDVIIGELNGPIRVLRNDANASGWLIVELKNSRAGSKNHRGLGAKIELRMSSEPSEPARPRAGDESITAVATPAVQTRWLFTGGGFQSSGAPYVHFGVGTLANDARAKLTITWPDGHRQHVEDIAPNQHLMLRRDE